MLSGSLYKSSRSWAPWKACPRLPHPQTFPRLSGDWGTRAHDKPSETSEKRAREMTGTTGDEAVSKAFRKWEEHKVSLLGIWWKILAHKWACSQAKRGRKNTLSPFSRCPFHATPHYLNVWNRLSAEEEPESLSMGGVGYFLIICIIA